MRIEHNLKLGAVSDVQKSKVENSLRWVEQKTRKIPIAGTAAKVVPEWGRRTYNECLVCSGEYCCLHHYFTKKSSSASSTVIPLASATYSAASSMYSSMAS